MAQQYKVSKNNTKIRQEGGYTIVRLHDTDVVKFNDAEVILNSGGWLTATTRTRMNQTCNQYALGCGVSSKGGQWMVSIDETGNKVEFYDGIVIKRREALAF